MADSDCIIVHEQVVVPDAAVVEEMVALPGEKGDKGDPFTYDDFTPEQIAELQRPATEAAEVANQAAENANKATSGIKALGVKLTAEEAKRESAESSRASAESERAEAEFQRETSFSQMQTTLEGLITDTRTATSNANTAAGNAENAATAANNSATLANAAAYKANQAAQNVDGRVTSLEEKASQVYENLAAIEASGETNPNKIYIDGETMQPYIYKGGKFVPFKGGENNSYIPSNWAVDNILSIDFNSNSRIIYNEKYNTYLSVGSNAWDCSFYKVGEESVNIINNGKLQNPNLDKISDDLYLIGYKGGVSIVSFETKKEVVRNETFENSTTALLVQYDEYSNKVLVGDNNKLYQLDIDLSSKELIKEYEDNIIQINRGLGYSIGCYAVLSSNIVDFYKNGVFFKTFYHGLEDAKFACITSFMSNQVVVVGDSKISISESNKETANIYDLVYKDVKSVWSTGLNYVNMYITSKRGIVKYRLYDSVLEKNTEFQTVLSTYDYSNVPQCYLPVTGFFCFGINKNIKVLKI